MVSVEGDCRDGNRRHKDGRRLQRPHELAGEGRVSKGPVLGQELHEGEGHGHQAQQEVRDGQVDDEHVPGRAHGRLPDDGHDHEGVARRPQHDQDAVDEDEGAEGGVADAAVLLELLDEGDVEAARQVEDVREVVGEAGVVLLQRHQVDEAEVGGLEVDRVQRGEGLRLHVDGGALGLERDHPEV